MRYHIGGKSGRNSPIVKYPAVFPILAASDKNTGSKAVFETRGKPADKPAIVGPFWKMKTEDPKQLLFLVTTRDELAPNRVISHDRQSIGTDRGGKISQCELQERIGGGIKLQTRLRCDTQEPRLYFLRILM